MASLSDTFQTVWTLIGYAVMFLVPVLAISKESRTVLKQFMLKLLMDEPSKAVVEVEEESPSGPSAPPPPVVSDIAESAVPTSASPSSSTLNSEQNSSVDPREIAKELRRRIESGEELDEDFVVRTASVLGISKETILGAFDVTDSPADPVPTLATASVPSSTGSTPLPSSSSAPPPTSSTVATAITPEPLATDWIRDLLPEGQEIGLLSR